MMQPTPRLRWTFLDCISLPLDGFPAAKVNRNGDDFYYILEQLWTDAADERRQEWRPIQFTNQGE